MSDQSDAAAPAPPRTQLAKLREVISLGALSIALAHLLFPGLTIDAITVVLVIISILPWLSPLVKSIELPGGAKLEFHALQKAESQAETAGLLSKSAAAPPETFSFQQIAEVDPNLALAGLRIELEKRLRKLAQVHGLPRSSTVGLLLKSLSEHAVLNERERWVLADLTQLLNAAVHGASVDARAAGWAMDVGPRLLTSLDERVAARAPAPAT